MQGSVSGLLDAIAMRMLANDTGRALLLPPNAVAQGRLIHAAAPPAKPDLHARERQLIEEIVEHRTLLAAAPGSDTLDAAMHTLFDPEPET